MNMIRVFRSAAKLAKGKIYYREGFCIRNCTSSSSSGPNIPDHDVPGLSKKTIDLPSNEVGFPGASKTATYKNPEYFCYHNTSFFEAEVEMMKYRLPQPSNKSGQK